ncbi:MAG TPA: glycoside hydrolase family 71 protein [Polyangiaceae bacterium]|nr:glycoside hydrolase family 71 protein [Polyangiaceae bacterium]
MRARTVLALSAALLLARCGSDDAPVDGGSDATADAASDVALDQIAPPDEGGPLPIDLPSPTTLKASAHKVFAHYFPPFPISIDDKDASADYYATQFLTPNGENGKHVAYGGFLRERPLPRDVDPSPDWQLDDMKTEVRRADAAGLDGFTVDILGLTGPNWTRIPLLLQAAQAVDPDFKIVLMPDGTSSDTADPNALATAIAGLVQTYASALFTTSDGRVVIAPFDPEVQGAAWWQTWIATMKTQGVDVAFVPCFLNYGSNVAAFDPFSYGFSNWGNRNPKANSNLGGSITDAHTRGKIWMQPVSVQDERPYAQVYDEADNSENLRVTWAAATAGADWVQIPTWNDYSEGAEIAPSTGTGYSPLDISAYYLVQFKTGAAPPIVRDVVYVSHRVQQADAGVTNETTPMALRANGSPPRDDVEILTFLTAPAQVDVTIGATKYTFTAPQGVNAQDYPLAAGAVSATASRNGAPIATITSGYPITLGDVPIQDLGYRFVSSGRGN